VVLLAAPGLLWWFKGESFLSKTDRAPADVLVVEGWVGYDALNFAKDEFEHGGYTLLVTTSGMTGDRWDKKRWSYAEEAKDRLLRAGISGDRIVSAPPRETDRQRTFEAASAVWRTLNARGVKATAINVLTFGPHARRSQLVYAKVFQPGTRIGVISFVPSGYTATSWWRSSDRSSEFVRETVGYVFELLLNSGRVSNVPVKDAP
jgi:hypothetical protein